MDSPRASEILCPAGQAAGRSPRTGDLSVPALNPSFPVMALFFSMTLELSSFQVLAGCMWPGGDPHYTSDGPSRPLSGAQGLVVTPNFRGTCRAALALATGLLPRLARLSTDGIPCSPNMLLRLQTLGSSRGSGIGHRGSRSQGARSREASRRGLLRDKGQRPPIPSAPILSPRVLPTTPLRILLVWFIRTIGYGSGRSGLSVAGLGKGWLRPCGPRTSDGGHRRWQRGGQ